MFGLAHRAVLLAPAEDAFGHCPTRLRQAVALVPRGASIDGALAALAGCGDAVVLYRMRRDVEGMQIGHMIDGVIGLAFAHHDAAIREQALRARRKLVGKLPITGELLRGSLLERTHGPTQQGLCKWCARRRASCVCFDGDLSRRTDAPVQRASRAGC